VLHDIAVGPVAEQPAGKGATPFIVGAGSHVELDEGAGFLDIFPGRAGFASLEADDRIADTQCFARLHRQIAGQPVALVEQADDGAALRHRRTGQHAIVGRADRAAFDLDRPRLVGGGQIIVATGSQRQGAGQQGKAMQDRRERPRRTPGHAASGLHAS
jgi:hypothetical protein